jgi:sigma-B regulation protein RsbU (phosphoserine phosphatase)
MRILIAEDDVTSRVMLSGVLQKSGHEVVETADGASALAVLARPDAPKLAIFDWMMPEMDGLQVVRRVRAIETSQPPYIIMLTTKGDKTDIVSGLEAGADDYLTKPFDLGELRARVNVGRRLLDVQAALAATIEELREAMEQIKVLRGVIPICAWCKKIRDDEGCWNQLEVYIRDHADVKFSHGICPACAERTFPES